MSPYERSKTTAPKTRFRWNREIVYYWIVSVLDPSKTPGKYPEATTEQKMLYECDILPEWRGHIIELKSPVMMLSGFSEAIRTDDFVIYSPFMLDRKSSITHALDDVKIPVLPEVDASRLYPIPDYAIRGAYSAVNNSDCNICHGIRIDTSKNTDPVLVLEMFLKLIRQYTLQWWVNSPRNPFDYGYRMSFGLTKNLSPRAVLMDGALNEIETPWAGNIATQTLIGIERKLSLEIWKQIAKSIESGGNAETVTSLFLEAISAFMAYDDLQTVLNLALVFEVAENKVRLLKGKNIENRNKKILSNPCIAEKGQIEIFRKIITDRDCIAHGRKPHHLHGTPTILAEYLDASTEFFNSYLNLCRKFGWDKVAELEL